MKVLFALSDDEVSEQIVKRYRKEYKEIISYKNVYYFNAIVKEIQKDKNYDRIVISEDLEQSVTNNINQMDKIIFEKLDAITDEATDARGKEIPIIFICSNYRKKSDYFAVKLFSLGIYNALIGNDREISEVCQLLKKPRVKKDAKIYYKIDSEESVYQSESENDVNETEIQNILSHYKKIGNDEKKCIESFSDIAEQYNEQQLKLIVKCLPLSVRAILEEKSERYKAIVLDSPSLKLSNSDVMRAKDPGAARGFKNVQSLLGNSEDGVKKEVIIPTNISLKNVKKVSNIQPKPVNPILNVKEEEPEEETNFKAKEDKKEEAIDETKQDEEVLDFTFNEQEFIENEPEEIQDFEIEEPEIPEIKPEEIIDFTIEEPEIQELESEEVFDFISEAENAEEEEPEEIIDLTAEEAENAEEEEPEEVIDLTAEEAENAEEEPEEVIDLTAEESEDAEEEEPEEIIDLTAEEAEDAGEEEPEEVIDLTAEEAENAEEEELEEIVDLTVEEVVEDEKTEEVEDEMHFIEEDEIPFESEKETLQLEESVSKYSKGTDKIFDGRLEQLIGFEETTDEKELSVKETEEQPKEQQEESNEEPVKEILIQPEKNSKKAKQETIKNIKGLSEYDEIYASGKKLVAFVGAHQVGTSFLVNHLAEILQAKGVNTAILDLTKNRDSYYMYTKGDEDLRNIAINTKDNLLNDRNAGIKVRRNLFVYTSLPDEDIEEKNIKAVLQKLILKHDLVLIDCDLDTPINCFAYVNEVYLVQNMDVLAVQPLTEFLAELKEENVLNNKKFNIIINKAIFVRGLSTKMLISAMSCYSNPEMTETKELFDKNKIDRNIIPFDLKAYAKYLEAIAECDMNIIGYPKKFMKSLKEVAMKICPHVKFK